MIRVRARASADELVGVRDGTLLVRVTAPPVDGRANRAVCRLIARRVGVAASNVTIVRGERSRDKVIRVIGVSSSELSEALNRQS